MEVDPGQPGSSSVPSVEDHSVRDNDRRFKFEILLAISRELAADPDTQDVARLLRRKINRSGLVPSRMDVAGQRHSRTLEEFTNDLPSDVIPRLRDVLLQTHALASVVLPGSLQRLPPRLINNPRNSLLRTKDSLASLNAMTQYVLSWKTLPESIVSIPSMLSARELGVTVPHARMFPAEMISTMDRHSRVSGHLAQAYSVRFDRTGRFLITAADDNLVKAWDATTGLLRFTFRGHSSPISDISVSYCNQFVATAASEKHVRVWSLQTGATIEVFRYHTAQITEVKFLPYCYGSIRFLCSVGFDCNVVFYKFDEEKAEFIHPVWQFNVRDIPNLRCQTFTHSASGRWVGVGDSNGWVRLFRLEKDEVIKGEEIKALKERVDSMEWSHRGLRFATSSSRDAVAKVWRMERSQWREIALELPSDVDLHIAANGKAKYGLYMLCWTLDDKMVITSGNDNILRAWNSTNGSYLMSLDGHRHDCFHLLAHPVHPDVVLSASHDGSLIFWRLGEKEAEVLKRCENKGKQGQGAASILGIDITADGRRTATVDMEGRVSVFGVGSDHKVSDIPKEQFFDTDYKPLLADESGFCIDESTSLAPHLMAPCQFVNEHAQPLEEKWQKRVPGWEKSRENTACPWLTRSIIHPISSQQRLNWALEVDGYLEEEDETYEQEILREPSPELQIIVPTADRRSMSGSRTRQRREAVARRLNIAQRRQQQRLTLAEEIARQDERRAQAAMVGYRSEDDESYSDGAGGREAREVVIEEGLDSESTTSDSDEDTSDSDFSAPRVRERRQESSVSMAAVEVTTSSGRRVRPPVHESETENVHRPAIRKRRRRREEEDEEEEDIDTNEPSTSAAAAPTTRPRRRVNNRNRRTSTEEEETADMDDAEFEEALNVPAAPARPRKPKTDTWYKTFPSIYRVTSRRRFPYFAQLGDKVVYFKQGHAQYLALVEQLKLYKVSYKMKPREDLSAEEFCIVDEIRYVVKPYRLMVVRLSQLDQHGTRTGLSFTVKYHDLNDSPDFIVLRHHYELSESHDFQEGDSIEAILDGKWWTGTVNRIQPVSEDAPESHWMCLCIKWDAGDDEVLSPWDVQPKQEGRRPATEAEEDDEIAFGDCSPEDGDWPSDSANGQQQAKEANCSRLVQAIAELSKLNSVADFTTPVSLDDFPDYAEYINYPIDLSTISDRLANGFYRRLRAFQQDVRFIATAAELYNQADSGIVRNARILVEALIRFSEDPEAEPAEVVASFDSLFDVPANEIVEHSRRQRPVFDYSEVVTLAAQLEAEEGPTTERGWVRDSRVAMEALLRTPWAQPFIKVDRNRFPELVEVLEEEGGLEDLMKDIGDLQSPTELLGRVKNIANACAHHIDDNRSPVYNNSIRVVNLAERKLRPIIQQVERIEAQPIVRNLRSRERRSVYNTRSVDPFSSPSPSRYTSQSGRRVNQPGFYRDLARGQPLTHDQDESPNRLDTTVDRHRRSNGRRREEERATTSSRRRVLRDSGTSSVEDHPSPPRRDRRQRGNRREQREGSSPHREPSRQRSGRARVELELEQLLVDNETTFHNQVDFFTYVVIEAVQRRASQRTRSKRIRLDSDLGSPEREPPTSSSRYSTRASNNINKKRRLESSGSEADSDAEEGGSGRRNGRRSEPRRDTRSSRRGTSAVRHTYNEHSDEDEDGQDIVESISSRGRLRRVRQY